MDCREAQALIMPFIEGKLSDEQTEKFLDHIDQCTDCYDELEVYYIVMVGVKQLDDEEHLIVDFNGDLKKYIDYKKEQLDKKHSLAARIRGALAAVLVLIVTVAGFLSYSIYKHPDLVARYRNVIASALNFEIDAPQGRPVSFVVRDRGDYFGDGRFEMPLRRIKISEEKETNNEQSSTD